MKKCSPIVLVAPAILVLALWASRVSADPLFGAKTDFGVGTNPWSVAIGDLNGDGKSDLAIANETSAAVSVLLGNGDGTFGTKRDFAAEPGACSVVLSDFNGDGKLDLAVACFAAATVSVLLGNGDGTFGAKMDFGAGGNAYSIAAGDLNGDGTPDLVTAYYGNTVSVRLGYGDGNFGAMVEYATGTSSYAVAIGDVNGDGKPDLATANVEGTVSVLLGNGNGTFGTKTDFAVGTSPLSLAIGDLNGDGKPDLAVANSMSNAVSVLLGNGDGTFGVKTDFGTGVKPLSVAIADLDPDGVPDLVTANFFSNTVSVLLGNGDGTFATTTDFGTGTNPHAAAVGDLNGDGKPDLAATNYLAGTVSVLLNLRQEATATSLTAAPNPSVFGQLVILTATVTPGTATGTVVFYDGAASLGTAAVVNGTASLGVSNLSKTVHSLTARYFGDAGQGTSGSSVLLQTVGAAGTSITVSASANPSLFGQSVSFSAAVTVTPPGSGIATGTVQFRVDDVDLGAPVSLSAGNATSPSTTTLSGGVHEVQAIYSGDASFDSSTSPVLADTVELPKPVIVAVRDVPGDQGGRVFVTWRCLLDQPGIQVVTGYRMWRRVPNLAMTSAEQRAPGGEAAVAAPDTGLALQRIRTVADDGSVRETFWEAVATLPSAQLVSYGYTAATTQDSMAGSNPYTAFFVQALTADPFEFFASAPDSGYSVDNLSPAQPTPFVALYGSIGVALHWGMSTESDMREYRLYRGMSPNFTPGPSNLLVAQPDTGFFDPSGAGSFAYKLSAVDIHGNESRFALVTAGGPVGTLASLMSAEVEGSVVYLRWLAVANPGLSATVYRRTPRSAWTTVGQVAADGTGIMAWSDAQVIIGQRYGYRLGIWDGTSEVFLGEAWIEVPVLSFALENVRPNPSTGEALTVSLSLPSDQPATLELFDLSGRRLVEREVGSLGPGQHRVDVGAGAALRAGMYVLRLTQGQHSQSLKAVVIR